MSFKYFSKEQRNLRCSKKAALKANAANKASVNKMIDALRDRRDFSGLLAAGLNNLALSAVDDKIGSAKSSTAANIYAGAGNLIRDTTPANVRKASSLFRKKKGGEGS